MCGFTLAGCFTTAADFRADAEKFILNDADLAQALSGDGSEVDFVEATCEEPASKDVGTTFTCNAKDGTGADWEFAVEIQESNNYDVTVSRFPTP